MSTWSVIGITVLGIVLLGIPTGTSLYAIWLQHRDERRRR